MIKAKKILIKDLIKWLLIAVPISAIPLVVIEIFKVTDLIKIYSVQLIYTLLWLLVGLHSYLRYAKIAQEEMKSLVKQEKLINNTLVMINTEEKLKNVLSLEIERIAFSGETTALVFFDVDELGEINERHGYDIGDQVIIDLIMSSKAIMGPKDNLGRIKGDTFCIMLPGQKKEEGYRVAKQIQSDVQKTSKDKGVQMTCRFVIMSLDSWTTDEQVLSLAYEQLRLAKKTGRGTIF